MVIVVSPSDEPLVWLHIRRQREYDRA